MARGCQEELGAVEEQHLETVLPVDGDCHEQATPPLLLLLEDVGNMTSRAYTFRQDSAHKPRQHSLQVQPVLVTKCDNIGPASDASSRHSSPAKTFKAASPTKRSMKVYEGFEAKVMKGGRPSCREDPEPKDPQPQEPRPALASLGPALAADPPRLAETPKPRAPLVAKLPGVGYQSPYKAPKPEPRSPRPQKENRQPVPSLALTNPR